MIHYQLRCSGGHEFESWFRSSGSFDEQSRSGLIECPACGSRKVDRALMAPAIGRRARAEAAQVTTPEPAFVEAPPAAPPTATVAMPDAMRAALQRIRAEVERNCDHVGPRFAEEARAMHRGERPVRGIYGDATPEQAEALADEGIEVARLPWVPPSDA